MNNLPEGDELEKECKREGIDISGERVARSTSGRIPRATDYELQQRLIEARRSKRESWLWLLAVISAIASMLSAAAAWFAAKAAPLMAL